MNSTEAIAGVAAARVRDLFAEGSAGAMLRVRGLDKEEITALVEKLEGWSPTAGGSLLQIVVTTTQAWPGLPSKCVLPPDASSTTFRNSSDPVLFVEYEEYSDAQGLRNVRAITDRELISESAGRRRLTSGLRGGLGESSILDQALERVFRAFRQAGNRATPPMRRWTALVAEVCRVLASARALDSQSVWTAVGDGLWAGGLFPDTRLPAANETERDRWLRRNVDQVARLTANSRGRDLDELYEKVQSVQFTELDGSETPEARASELRREFSEIIRADRRHTFEKVELRYWEQVEARQTDRKGLGDRVREQIAAADPDREFELPEELIDGLNAGDAESAVEFLDLEPAEGQTQRLSMLLDPKLRGRLEKVADPPQRATRAPLRKLLAELYSVVSDEDEELGGLLLERRQRKTDDDLSAALFAWVYGPTLRRVSEATADRAVSLLVNDELLDTSALAKFIEQAESGKVADSLEPNWADLRLQVRLEGKKSPLVSFEWRPREIPGLLALARQVWRADAAVWSGPEESNYDDWVRSAFEAAPLRDGTQAGSDGLKAWADIRTDHLLALRSGLDGSAMLHYASRFESELGRVREEHVPQGVRDEVVGELLRLDTFRSDDGSEVVMLATHPIRQRWVGTHFAEMERLLRDCLEGSLRLNPINDGALFFDHIEKVSPHAQPPVLVNGDEQLLAVREQDWAEHFEVLQDQKASRKEWLAGLDDGAIDEVADVVARYVAAYPHKVDGLHLLFIVRRRGARSLERLVARVRKLLKKSLGEDATIRLSLVVEPLEVREVERVLQQFDSSDKRNSSDFPELDVRLHEWDVETHTSPPLDEISSEVDIVVVPNLFGAETVTREATVSSSGIRTQFSPWLDEPTRIESADSKSATSVSRILLPSGGDVLLEAWSTINTRQFRRRPVGSDPTPDDVDYFELQVPFGESAGFFKELHKLAHWVVTVDAFVGREQVDGLKDGPDVILVKTGVGSNDGYRMVVSSESGRDFIVRRLQRRLHDQMPDDGTFDFGQVAHQLYERARYLVPGIVLRSLGLGRTAAEMVGLVCARARVAEKHPVDLQGHGFEAWISLDEHAEWLGGVRRSRADMARFVGRWTGKTLELEVLVVEAKMRRSVDLSRADEQIQRSVQLLDAALSSEDSDEAFKDVAFWRREVLRAIEQASVAPEDLRAACRIHVDGEVRGALDDAHRASILSGRFELRSVEGVLVTLADHGHVDDQRTPAGFEWLRLNTRELSHLLARLTRENEWTDVPTQRPAPAPTETPEPTGQRTSPTTAPAESDQALKPSNRGGETPRALQRYQRVLDVLSEHRVGVVALPDEPAVEGPGFYVFRVGLESGQRPASVYKLGEELKYGLGLDAGHEPRSFADRGAVVIEVPKRSDERYYVDAAQLWAITEWPEGRLYAPLGADVRDEVVGIEFSSSRSPHLLIGGMTGGGKSVALETLLWGLAQHYPPEELELWLVDPKGNEFVQFEQLPHVRQPIGMDADDAIEMLEEAVEEMDRRYRLMKDASRARRSRVADLAGYNQLVGKGERFAWIVVVLDEFADLTAEKESRKTIELLLQRLAQKARACGIHCVVATQKPSAEVISTTTRSNLGAQLALRVRSAVDSRVIMETTGAESLAGNGDGFLRLSGEEPIRLQCAKVSDESREAAQARWGGEPSLPEDSPDVDEPLPSRLVLYERYEVIAEISGGAMAQAYKVRDKESGDDVFLKRAVLDGSFNGDAMMREANIYQKLQRAYASGVMDVRDVQSDGNSMAIITDFADGGTLEAHVRRQERGFLTGTETKQIALEILEGLRSLHGVEVIHRDLKPANILRHQQSWKLADFGIAKNLRRLMTQRTFQQAGTKGYAPPEQYQGAEAHASADIYSFGKLITFMLTGGTDVDTIPSDVWGRLVRRCTERDPWERADLEEVEKELKRLPI
ncbi:MAG: hypothetical protein EP330_08530 [Deltaproteobacteria bacterium]|nr:MAG: hypothetical protein EP330_08530 [Deltaproteobacteria bacterium]